MHGSNTEDHKPKDDTTKNCKLSKHGEVRCSFPWNWESQNTACPLGWRNKGATNLRDMKTLFMVSDLSPLSFLLFFYAYC